MRLLAVVLLLALVAVDAGPNEWECLDGISSPVRLNDAGDAECYSLNNGDCQWDTCPTVPPADAGADTSLSCGDEHLALYGITGYDDPSHWCAKARVALGNRAVTLIVDGAGCGSQSHYFGEKFAEPADCAAAAEKEDDCYGSFMFSDGYSPTDTTWGCRCCDQPFEGAPNDNWDVYYAGCVNKIVPGAGCGSQSTFFGTTFATPEACAAEAGSDPLCTGAFMFSPYTKTEPTWGCRCCNQAAGGDPNTNWDVYYAGCVTKVIDGAGCGSQSTFFSTTFATPESCAAAAANDPACTGSFMFGPYTKTEPTWGCRCCQEPAGGDANANWDVYSYSRVTQIIDNAGCGSQSKYFEETFQTPSECALKAIGDTECSGTIMFSEYTKTEVSWGCRCCLQPEGGDPNENWDVYRYDIVASSVKAEL